MLACVIPLVCVFVHHENVKLLNLLVLKLPDAAVSLLL